MSRNGFQRWLGAVNALMRRLLRRGPAPDPYAYVAAPVRRGPNLHGGAVALAGPEEPRSTDLRGS